ncbi:MAG: DUF2306 domain-containing protein [Kordiimonas sp.]
MKRALWALMAFLSVSVAIWSWRLVFVDGMLEQDGWQHHLFRHPLATYAHFGLGPLALLVGSFQFLDGLRKKWPHVHRVIGWIYIVSCMLAGVGALPLAINSAAGPIAAVGFGLLAAAWLYSTTSVFWAAQARRFDRHRIWMIRSYALTFAGVTLRLYLTVFAGVLGFDFSMVYMAAAWACWVINLIVAELFIIARLQPINT